MSLPPARLKALRQSPAWRKIMEFYWQLKPGLWLMKLPVVGARLQQAWIRAGADSNWILPAPATRVPVGETISTGRQMLLPGVIVERLMAEAGGIFRMHACPCRVAFKCHRHAWDTGCLHLGPAVDKIPADLGVMLTVAEGQAHLRRALDDGLLPTVLQVSSEAEIFRLNPAQMLSICFCCECCCDVRLMLRDGPNRYWDLYNHRLPGLTLAVSEACTRCGCCAEVCYGGERVITMGAQKAEIHECCVGCGRCVAACPQQAIAMQFDPQADVVETLLQRIRQRVEIRASGRQRL